MSKQRGSKQKDGKNRSRVVGPEAKRAAQIKKLQALRATQGAAQSGALPPSALGEVRASANGIPFFGGQITRIEASDHSLQAITDAANDPDPLSEGVERMPDVDFVVDLPAAPVVDSSQAILPQAQGQTMTLTLKGISRNGKRAIYTGAALSITIGLAAFPDKNAPSTIEVADGVFAPARTPKAQLTDAEKAAAKEARKNAPKPTLAERVERRRIALARDEAKLAAASSM